MTGYLNVIFGPMFSGKSGFLLEAINNYISFNQLNNNTNIKILIINSVKDCREDLNKIKNLTTHNKYKNYNFPHFVESINVEKLEEIKEEDIKKYDYFAIDESQFFDDLKEFVDKCLSLNKYVNCAGLIADTEKKPFGQIYRLIPYADEVKQLKAYCVYCNCWYRNAVFTKWVGKEEKKDKIVVGASGKYVPTCGEHFDN